MFFVSQTTRMQRAKGQGHTRAELDLDAWPRHHHSPPRWVEWVAS